MGTNLFVIAHEGCMEGRKEGNFALINCFENMFTFSSNVFLLRLHAFVSFLFFVFVFLTANAILLMFGCIVV